MTKAKIEMHFQEIKQLSDQVRDLAEEIKKNVQEKLMGAVTGTKQVWNSECADLLIGKEVRFCGQLLEEADELLRIAVQMEEQAEKMYRMEMINQLLAETRIYL